MKILTLADEENKGLWDFYDKSKTEGVDLIISCGDLNSHYLQYLETMVNCPLLYVRGNHDRHYDQDPPQGCSPIDDRIYDYQGLRILGLGGSMRYKEGSDMYTEAEMRSRIKKLNRQVALRNGIDILVTHSPAKGYGDLEDLPHQGFECFNEFLEKWKPKYMLHGHVHKTYGAHFQRIYDHPSGTKIINCYDTFSLEITDDDHPARGKTGSMLYDLYTQMQDRRTPSRYN
ncbi:Predicted phosphoesterase [Lachnospiraceae bacterium C10]|nr:Predicted phosphoesterase [Lachnospiraceae bacterium C10]SDW27827.1 Predicted phosphoesterase [Lachnospiraceae bacterium KHCPX20]